VVRYFWAAALQGDMSELKALAAPPADSAAQLAHNLNRVNTAILETDLKEFDIAAARRWAPEIIRALFEIRAELRGRIPGWRSQGVFSRDAQCALRGVLRTTRYAGDMIGELATGFIRLPPRTLTYKGFGGPPLSTQVDRTFAPDGAISFRPGDVLLMRGMHHNSAAIARIGDIDSQFSHIAIVHADKNGKHVVVEALIEDGSIINPLDHVLHHGLGRLVLFRHKDAALAERAAHLIYERIARSRGPKGKPILYDFTMQLQNTKELFCANLVRLAYTLGSGGNVDIPMCRTRLDAKNRDFLDRIGVKAVETFAPGDIELEPDFHLVAEWADYRVTSSLRLQDLIMDRLFAWMDDHDYRFKEDFVIRLVGLFGRMSAFMSERAKEAISEIVPKVPRNMRRQTIAAVAMLHRTAEPLLQELLELERASVDTTSRPLDAATVHNFLEQKRELSGKRLGYLVQP
jgi:hypothetical protein